MATTKTSAASKAKSAAKPKAATKGAKAAPAPVKAAAPTKSAPAKSAPAKPAPAAAATRKPAKPKVDADLRRHYVEVAAYYIAERRGFLGGCEIEDWATAEREIDLLLQAGKLSA